MLSGGRVEEETGTESDAQKPLTGVEEIVDRIDEAADARERLSLGDIVDCLGRRSFVPLLLIAGLVMLAPVIGDIPGVPVLMGLLVILVAGQLLLRRDQIWLPNWLRNRATTSHKVQKTVGWLRRPAQFMDRWTKRRYPWLVDHAGFYVIAAVCIAIAAATPVMEVVPFSANFAGAAITAFALALLAHDGLLALAAIACSLLTVGLMVHQLV